VPSRSPITVASFSSTATIRYGFRRRREDRILAGIEASSSSSTTVRRSTLSLKSRRYKYVKGKNQVTSTNDRSPSDVHCTRRLSRRPRCELCMRRSWPMRRSMSTRSLFNGHVNAVDKALVNRCIHARDRPDDRDAFERLNLATSTH